MNLGAALPVHEALGTAAIAGRSGARRPRARGRVTPEIATLAVLLCAPLALLGRKADRLVEIWNERLAARAEAELAHHHPRAAVRANLYGLVLPFSVAAVLAPAGAAVAELGHPRRSCGRVPERGRPAPPRLLRLRGARLRLGGEGAPGPHRAGAVLRRPRRGGGRGARGGAPGREGAA